MDSYARPRPGRSFPGALTAAATLVSLALLPSPARAQTAATTTAAPPHVSSGAPASNMTPAPQAQPAAAGGDTPGGPVSTRAADQAANPIPETLTLQEALRLARLRNPALAASRADADAVSADRLTAALRPNPALTVESSGYPLFSSNRPGFWGGQETTVRIDQELETGGRRRLRTAVAAASADIARLDYQNRAREVALLIKRAYFAAVLAQTDRGVAQTTLAEIDKVIALNRARFEQGEISGAELRRLQVERLRFVDDVSNAELALKNARSTLLALLNAPRLDDAVTLTESLAAPPVDGTPVEGAPVEGARIENATAPPASSVDARNSAPAIAAAPRATTAPVSPTPARQDSTALAIPSVAADALVDTALNQRPDAQAARRDQARAETSTRLQQALRRPNVTVGAGYLRDRRVGSNGNGIIVGATFPLPLFDRNQGGIARAEAERRAADARADAVSAAVRLDLQQALDAVATSRARVRYIEREYLTTAREARDIVFESYRVGAADLIDYLDAQRAFRDTLRTYNRALFDERVSLFALAAATGQPDPQP